MERRTNMQIIKKVMELHPLAQAMVMSAVEDYAGKVAATTAEDYPTNSIVHPGLWIEVAKDVLKVFDEDRGVKTRTLSTDQQVEEVKVRS